MGLVGGTGRCHYTGLRLLFVHPCASTTIKTGATEDGGQRAVAAPVGLTCPHPVNRPSRHRWQSKTSISGQCGGVPAIVAAGILIAPPHPRNRPFAHRWPSMTLKTGRLGGVRSLRRLPCGQQLPTPENSHPHSGCHRAPRNSGLLGGDPSLPPSPGACGVPPLPRTATYERVTLLIHTKNKGPHTDRAMAGPRCGQPLHASARWPVS